MEDTNTILNYIYETYKQTNPNCFIWESNTFVLPTINIKHAEKIVLCISIEDDILHIKTYFYTNSGHILNVYDIKRPLNEPNLDIFEEIEKAK